MKFDFERQTEHGIYRDAIMLPDDHTFSQDQIESMMQQRVDNWLTTVNNMLQASSEPEPEYIEINGVKYLKAE